MITLSELQKKIPDSQIFNCDDPDSIKISTVVTLYQEKPNSITYISEKSYQNDAKKSNADAIVTLLGWEKLFENKPVLAVKNVDLTLIELLNIFYPTSSPSNKKGQFIVIDPSVKIGDNTEIGNFVSIDNSSSIGKNCKISDGVKIGKNVSIGDNSVIGPNCVIFDNVKIGNDFLCFANTTIGGGGISICGC